MVVGILLGRTFASAPPRSLSSAEVGLFGLVGAAGAGAAVRAGRLADRGLGEVTTAVALTLALVSWLPIGLAPHPVTWLAIPALVVGLLLLDLAVQAVHVTSQSMIYAVDPEARSRLAGAYMIFYSVGSAVGSTASTATYAWAGWTGVCVLGASVSALALAGWAATLGSARPVPTAAPRSAGWLRPTPVSHRSRPAVTGPGACVGGPRGEE